jgi:hypothetical protein
MAKVETVKTYTVAPDMLDDEGFAAMLDALARGLDAPEALKVPGVVAVGEVEFEVADEPDDVTPDAEELAHMEATEALDPGHPESYPGEREPEFNGAAFGRGVAQSFQDMGGDLTGYEPPVDDDGFQCGMCLLNRRQCLACARREAELQNVCGR